ncbi:MAG: hypothetical protein HC905_10690 [Bacteroidales bacterium]|nr:hypothetical protein [Bacteroidales bacterium]
MAINRNYSCKDVNMLMASKTIAESFKTNISELSTTRTDWTEQYATDLILKIMMQSKPIWVSMPKRFA